MRAATWFGLAVAMALGAAAPAAAKLVNFTYHGTLGQIDDPSGVFGGASAGDAFTLVFRANSALGLIGGGGGGYTDSNFLTGGTIFTDPEANADHPTLRFSPVSATLTIGGHDLVFAGNYFGDATVINDCFGELTGGHCTGSIFQTAQDEGDALHDYIRAGMNLDYYAALGSVLDPLSLVADGGLVQGLGDFNYTRIDGTGAQTSVSGLLAPSDLTVAAVPDARTWALMLVGFGFVGAASRRRPRDSAAAVA